MAKTIFALRGPLADSGRFSGKVAFSNGVKVTGGELVFVSGQLAMDVIVGSAAGARGTNHNRLAMASASGLTSMGTTFSAASSSARSKSDACTWARFLSR